MTGPEGQEDYTNEELASWALFGSTSYQPPPQMIEMHRRVARVIKDGRPPKSDFAEATKAVTNRSAGQQSEIWATDVLENQLKEANKIINSQAEDIRQLKIQVHTEKKTALSVVNRNADLSKRATELWQDKMRLLQGNFTKDEIQNLCHNLHDQNANCTLEEFDQGCKEFQRKLFGKAANDNDEVGWNNIAVRVMLDGATANERNRILKVIDSIPDRCSHIRIWKEKLRNEIGVME